MRVIGVVPARGGSKGIPRKNLVDLGGRPLIAWTADAALTSHLDRVILSTDDPEIATVGAQYGLEVPFLRPRELASDDALSIDVVWHALEASGESPDAVMVLQPTSPFRSTSDIDEALSILREPSLDAVISVIKVGDHHPSRMKLVVNGLIQDPPFAERVEGQPRQQLEDYYLRNGAIYLTRISTLLSRRFQGARTAALVMPACRSLNIDEPFDLSVARSLVSCGLVQ